jgi:hypothetical protein
MLQNCSICSGVGYAQLGYFHKNYGQTDERFFWEYKSVYGSHVTTLWGTPIRGYVHISQYRVILPDGKIRLLVDGFLGPDKSDGTPAVTPFDPIDQWAAIGATYSGEVLNVSSDIMGTEDYQVDINDVQTKNASDNWLDQDVSTSNMFLVMASWPEGSPPARWTPHSCPLVNARGRQARGCRLLHFRVSGAPCDGPPGDLVRRSGLSTEVRDGALHLRKQLA